MTNILMVTTSYPINKSGEEAAGSFVADLAESLSKNVSVFVLTPGLREDEVKIGMLTVHYFAVPKLPLSLLNPLNPKDSEPVQRIRLYRCTRPS